MKTSRFISLLLCVVMIMSLFTGLAGSASADDVITHEVQSGEIMLKICEKHGLNYYACKDAIMQLNGFTSEAQLGKLSVGQKLKLPASDALAKTTSTSTAVVTSTTVGGTTLTTTTNYVGTTASGGNVAYYLTAYTVQSGDTLNSICSKLGSNYYYYSPVILGINSLTNANFIRPGQVLLIPTTSAPGGAGYTVIAHQVQPGETTTSICNRYGVSYQAMRQLVNGLNRRNNMDKIYAGQTIYVPSTGTVGATTTVSTGTVTTTTGTTSSGTTSSGTVNTNTGYAISFSNSGAFASVNGQDYVSAAPAGSEVSVWSNTRAGYAVKSLDVIRLDTGAPVPVDYNYFTMPSSNVYVEVAYEKGLTITKAKAQGGSFETLVGGFLSSAAFAGDEVTILAYPNQYYSVKSVSYQKTDGTVTAVDVKKDSSGNYSFTMPNYPITVSVKYAPTQYHSLSYSGIVGNGTVSFYVGENKVTQVEQGELVTMKFVADTNWSFNTFDFENNLSAHIPNKSSMGSFKKVDNTTYSFVMGTQDVNIVGVQFLNRNSYSIYPYLWKDANNATNGNISINVIDQVTGTISFGVNQAKFGDTVQVIYAPNTDYVIDAQYTKDNSRGAGNGLLAWSSDNTFTMPDSNVAVNARYILDGAKHSYSAMNYARVPAEGGTVELIADNCVMGTAEVGKVVTVKITPKPDYDVSIAKVVGSDITYSVTLNGKLVGDAPASSSFSQVDKYTYTFVKSSGIDTIQVSFASVFRGVNATFTQITEGGDLVVQGIKGFTVNGCTVSGDFQVIKDDTVSFTVDLKDGYEITSVRKYIQDKSIPGEIPNTTTYIPGGTNNSYSYTVTKADIDAANSVPVGDGQLVFEITCRKNPETFYTVKYSEPRIEGQIPYLAGTSNPAYYHISATQISSGKYLPFPTSTPNSVDVSGLSGNLVDANDVMVNVEIPKNYVTVKKLNQVLYYAFDKLLLNGVECTNIDSSADPSNYVASFILSKDIPDSILTTEVVYKHIKTEDVSTVKITKLTIGSDVFDDILKAGVFDYAVSVKTSPSTIAITTDPSTAEIKELWLNGKRLDNSTTNFEWVVGPNTLIIKLGDTGYADTTYTFTVNYGMEASALKSLTVDGKEVTPLVTDPAYPAELTIYEATAITSSSSVALASVSGTANVTWDLNGEIVYLEDPAGTKTVNWIPGANTLKLSVTESGKAPTTYVVHVNYVQEASSLKELKISNYNSNNNFLVAGQYEYDITIPGYPSDFKAAVFDATSDETVVWLNGEELSSGVGDVTLNNLNWNNGVGVSTLQITVTQPDKAPSTYLIKVTPEVKPAAMDIYMTLNDNMVKFTNHQANYTTYKETAEFKIKLDVATANNVKMEINGFEQLAYATTPYTSDTTITQEVKAGESVEKWKIGSNEVKIYVIGTDMAETIYTMNVNYQTEPLKLTELWFGGVKLSLETNQVLTTNASADVITAKPEYSDSAVKVDIRVNGTSLADGSGTQTATASWIANTMNYLDIFVYGDGMTTGTYHIDVTQKTP